MGKRNVMLPDDYANEGYNRLDVLHIVVQFENASLMH